MARKVFFSFHFQRDSFRVSQVRNSTLLQPAGYTAPHFYDRVGFEQIKRTTGIKSWIDSQLHGTSVTVVLVGKETNGRPWVQYEIEKSWNEKKGLLGVFIHNVRDPITGTDAKGDNPFDDFFIDTYGHIKHRSKSTPSESFSGAFGLNGYNRLSGTVKTYDWELNNGRKNIGGWIEEAASQAGR